MVGHIPLKDVILVRIQVPQHQSERYRVTGEPYFTTKKFESKIRMGLGNKTEIYVKKYSDRKYSVQ